jgi:chitodextrinase
MMKRLLILVFVFAVMTSVSYAASDEFRVRMLIGTDGVPPTVPLLQSVMPVAQTQIDIVWSASTDDFIFGGYQVFRDAVQIATTSQTTYSDSGLLLNTSYSYFIRAFDSSFNISTSSNTMSTSTLAPVATTTPSTTSSSHTGSVVRMNLDDFVISPSLYSVRMDWKTSRYAQYELRWGRSTSYELGFLTNQVFKKLHSTAISDLEPGTVYEFELISYDERGVMYVLKKGQFRTLDAPDVTAPSNVSSLLGWGVGTQARLTWTNPPDGDFSYVRVVRNYLFYPHDPYDGFLAYQGSAEGFIDQKAFVQQETQFYTVFSYDRNGNVSSGAIVRVSKEGITNTSYREVASSSLAIRFRDIEFIQEGKSVGDLGVNPDLPLTIRIAYQKLPEHLKSIIVVFTHPIDADATFSFMLRVNKDKSYYEATVAPLKKAGMYPVSLSIFDHQTRMVSSVSGEIVVNKSFAGTIATTIPFFTTVAEKAEHVTLAMFIILLLLLLVLYRLFLLFRNSQARDR